MTNRLCLGSTEDGFLFECRLPDFLVMAGFKVVCPTLRSPFFIVTFVPFATSFPIEMVRLCCYSIVTVFLADKSDILWDAFGELDTMLRFDLAGCLAAFKVGGALNL